MQQELWVGTIPGVLYEVPVLANRFFFPKRGLSVSDDNLITQRSTFDNKRRSLKMSCCSLSLLKWLGVAGNLPLCFWIQAYEVHHSRDRI